ncbi:hypothetical protein MKMG_01014 [Methanogenium sp. MK-MG]|nr:hypothetical protein MKMG_01014 [Methanogenium sp. MK-MG]
MSVASQSVENTSGLHVAISGNSGKGKSHACSTMIQLLPEDYRLTGTVSNKALFYHDSLQPGTVLLFDDISLSEEMREILKSATASFRESIQHRTLTRERQLKLCTIPERCVWWLAKVESVGDDQVMNRMLTVWIDDSVQQDQKVVGHMKLADAKRHGERQTDTGIGVCREIWRIIKQQIVYVLIPFSPRICFRTTANRRNPAMLLDLIKCHALLHCCQRERDDEGSIIASHEDYIYARRLYLSINGNFGGQETKQTRNEAAALETIWKMGLEIFTVRQLQQALGLSYQPTYRLLHGYNNNKATYTGILDKCPAVSLIDATVAEEICGIALKRRDHYFFFDREVYREWMEKADVWIGDSDYEEEDYSDPDDFTPSPGLHPRSETDGPSKKNRIDNHSSKELQYRDICTDRERLFHEGGASFTRADTGGGRDLSIYDSGMSEDESQDGERTPPLTSIGKNRDISGYPHKSKPKKTGEEVKINRGEGHTPPLPGILDHRDFRRSRVSLGHCTLCNEGPAVYHSREQRASVCETCYARLVREANRGEGVG